MDNKLTNKFELYIIILPRVEKYCIENIENGEDKLLDWCKFFKDPYSEEVKEIMTRNNDIKEAKEELDRLNGDYEIQRLAELREKAIRDEASRIYSATQKGLKQGLEQGLEQGIQQGIQQGLEQGKKEEKILIAKRLLQLGISVSDIAKTTDLTEEEIAKLK